MAYGYDALVKFEKDVITLGSICLSKVQRDDGIQVYAPNFDRRHNVNLVANVKMGKEERWFLSVRWNLGTGFPFTLT